MNTLLFSKTPTVTVIDNRGLTVRDIAYHRHPGSPYITEERITRHQYEVRGFLTRSTDPRLHNAGLTNFKYVMDLTGGVLRTQGVDNGTTINLNDAAGRPSIAVSNISTAADGKEDRSQAVIRTWQYEGALLLGRPLSITEQATGEAARITERFIYAGNTNAEKALNLSGQCVSHYDTAGLVHTDSIAMTGARLSVTRYLLKDADNPSVVVNWLGADATAWNNLLAGNNEAHTTLTTADATGAELTTTDTKGNLQRVAYDMAGLLASSWLRLKNGTEQVIIKSLTYSAARQKLREEHGNGVVTTYRYEAETQRLIGIKTERPTSHKLGAKVLQDLRYEYDPVGNVLKISNDAEETRFWRSQKVVPENTYTYDSLYQLVSATGREMANASQQGSSWPSALTPLTTDNAAYTNYTRTYSYDNAGNLTQINHSPATGSGYTTKITVSDRSNRAVLSTLTENAADVDAFFTASGQQKQLQQGQNLIWTRRDELQKVAPVVRTGELDDSENYRYDAGNQRILKVSVQKTNSSRRTRRTLYLLGLELRTTSSGSTETESLQLITMGEAGRAQVRLLHWDSGKPDGINNDQIRYSYDNQISSSGLELDGEGNIISMEEYYPYGGTAIWTARSTVEANYKTIRYSGKERDATGLYYYGYRYYQPWVGRWLSADPAGTVDGMNLFRMVRNNPVVWKDNDGRAPIRNMIPPAPPPPPPPAPPMMRKNPPPPIMGGKPPPAPPMMGSSPKPTPTWTEVDEPRQITSLKYYTAQGYSVINKYLRGHEYNKNQAMDTLLTRGYATVDDPSPEEFENAMSAYINDITEGLSSLPETDHKVVYRGLMLDNPALSDILSEYSTVNNIITEKAFMSTSPDKAWINDTIFSISLEKGHKGRILGNLAHFEDEAEMLFPPNTKLKIESLVIRGNSDFTSQLSNLRLSDHASADPNKIKRIINMRVLNS